MEYSAKALARSDRRYQLSDDFNMEQYSDYNNYVGDSKFEYYRIMMGLGYIDSCNGKIEPGLPITRAEATDVVYRMIWK